MYDIFFTVIYKFVKILICNIIDYCDKGLILVRNIFSIN